MTFFWQWARRAADRINGPKVLPPKLDIPYRRRQAIRETVAAVVGERKGFEEMIEGEDGWTEWVHPMPGYLMQCCDCGLVHEMQFAIGKARDKGGPFNEGEGDRKGVVLFRARRHTPDRTGEAESETGLPEGSSKP